jgi:hypothetical protein
MMNVFAGKDMDAYKQFREEFLDDNVHKFLDCEANVAERVGYKTFCRSGNTFLRKYLELITMVPTGSEMPLTVT